MPDLYAYIDRVMEFMEQAVAHVVEFMDPAVADWLVAGEPWIKTVADGTIWEAVPNQLVVIGLLYALIGVFILARGLARAPIVALRAKATVKSTSLAKMVGPMAKQRADARFGLVFLTLGMGLQLAGTLGVDWPAPAHSGLIALLLLMAIAYLSRLGLIRRRVRNA